MRIFNKANILIPNRVDMTKWSCIACDQFTADPEYWRRVEKLVGGAPSTVRLIIPEARVKDKVSWSDTKHIFSCMDDYLYSGVLEEIDDSLVYVERTLPSGALRRGLVGVLDLDAYDWAEGTATPIRATEGTVDNRLLARVTVRMGAALELPHIMVFINDPENAVIPSAAGGEELYNFELMEGGGHIKGSWVTGDAAERVLDALEALPTGGIRYAIGDGNHSLAAAKRLWETVKASVPAEEWDTHPARFSLVELVNIHDEAVLFRPIHRALFNTEPSAFLNEAAARFASAEDGRGLTFIAGDRELAIKVPGLTIGQLIGEVESFCQDYISAHGGKVDYIHGDSETREIGSRQGCAAVLLPVMEKGELFSSVEESGPFPKKSFSIGEARDKRYYLECRLIKKDDPDAGSKGPTDDFGELTGEESPEEALSKLGDMGGFGFGPGGFGGPRGFGF